MTSPYTVEEFAAHKAYRAALDALLTEFINFPNATQYNYAVSALVRLRHVYAIAVTPASMIVVDMMLASRGEDETQEMLADVWRNMTSELFVEPAKLATWETALLAKP